MSDYRPICDVWILARSKVKFFGAYPAGFLHRARALLGVGPNDGVLHVCSGRVNLYPYAGFSRNDVTMDLDPSMQPHIHGDANDFSDYERAKNIFIERGVTHWSVLADPPYSPEFAKEYEPGSERFVTGDQIVKHSITILPVGGRVGVLSLGWPRYPKGTARQVAIVGVLVGNGNLGRWFAVYERTA